MSEMQMLELLQFSTDEATFVDIGAHVGPHALYAAALGYPGEWNLFFLNNNFSIFIPVVAVEPAPFNLLRIHKSVILNQFQDRFTLLPYAMLDEYRKVGFFEIFIQIF